MMLIWKIDQHLRKSGERPCQFGRRVARDPNLVKDMRNGRQLGPRLQMRIETLLSESAEHSAPATAQTRASS